MGIRNRRRHRAWALAVSHDGGRSWAVHPLPDPVPPAPTTRTVTAGPGIRYATARNTSGDLAAVHTSVDSGTTWTKPGTAASASASSTAATAWWPQPTAG